MRELKMKNLFIFSVVMMLGYSLRAQSFDETLQAFRESYAAEVDSNFVVAIQKLQDVYQGNSYELNLRLGWLNYLNRDYTKSSEYYEKCMKLLPYTFEAKFGYVLPQAAMGNWSDVIGTYEEILKTDPQNTLANYRMGAIYYERQDYQKAFLHLEKVVNLYPFDYSSVILLAWTDYHLGKLREAKVLFEKSLLVRPEDRSALEGLELIK